MTTLKQLSKIKNLLIEAKLMSSGLEDLNLTTKLDMAMDNFIEAYKLEESKARLEGKDGNDILLMLRD
jgi:hypothetical protein